MTAEREKIYDLEVKRRRVAAKGGYEPFWKIKSVTDTLGDADTEFRCKDCHGEVRLLRKLKAGGASPHAEHKHRYDSEYCPAGLYFRKAADGRESRFSEKPVR